MARRNTAGQDQALEQEQVNTEAQDTEAPEQEAPVTPTDPAPEQGEQEVNAEAQAEAPKVIDLTAFKAAVGTALGEKDETTGDVPLAAVEPVSSEYRNLDGTKAKNQATKWLEEQMKAALMGQGDYSEPNFADARAYVQIKDHLASIKGGTKDVTPADPKAAYVTRLAAVHLAANLITSDVPDGVDADAAWGEVKSLVDSLDEQAKAYLAWQVDKSESKGDAPDVSPVVRQAVRLVQGKSGGPGRPAGSHSGPRRDVAEHIKEAFAGVEPGTFLTVAQIAKFDSETYRSGDVQDHPSNGAVQQRLFPKKGSCSIEGIEPVAKTATTANGARKAA